MIIWPIGNITLLYFSFFFTVNETATIFELNEIIIQFSSFIHVLGNSETRPTTAKR
jgi:hypothetical protein